MGVEAVLNAVWSLLPPAAIETVNSLRRMNLRQISLQVLNFVTIVASAFMMWKLLSVVTNNEGPIVVVLSESMSPAFERGDILFLTMYNKDPILAGDIIVFKIKGRDIPIVHRVLKVHEDSEGKIKVLTKGDNNEVPDRGLYNRGQLWLSQEDIIGRVRGYVPWLGMVTIIMNDYPQFKYGLISILGFLAILTRE